MVSVRELLLDCFERRRQLERCTGELAVRRSGVKLRQEQLEPIQSDLQAKEADLNDLGLAKIATQQMSGRTPGSDPTSGPGGWLRSPARHCFWLLGLSVFFQRVSLVWHLALVLSLPNFIGGPFRD